MRRMGYGINSYHRTASIVIEYAPVWVFWLGDIFNFLCDKIPSIPLPPIPLRLFDEISIEFNDGKKWTTLREWYGDLQGLFHSCVHDKIDNFCERRTDTKSIEVPYTKARKVFYDKDKVFWDGGEATAKEIIEEDKNG